jgi:hypothetical protein
MPDDVTVTERIFDADGNLVATPGDRISADDAQRWGVGPDGTTQMGDAAPAEEEEPEPERPRSSQSGRRGR